jgi:hypothetical protein
MSPEKQRERLLKRILPGLAIGILYFSFLSGPATKGLKTARDEIAKLRQQGTGPAVLPGLRQEQQRLEAELKALRERQQAFGLAAGRELGPLLDPAYILRLSDRISGMLAMHHLPEITADPLGEPGKEPTKETAPAAAEAHAGNGPRPRTPAAAAKDWAVEGKEPSKVVLEVTQRIAVARRPPPPPVAPPAAKPAAEAGAAGKGGAAPAPPPAPAPKPAAPAAPTARPLVWRVYFTGFYPEVYRMMHHLSILDLPVIPVALAMKPAPDDRLGMTWSLALWVGVKE